MNIRVCDFNDFILVIPLPPSLSGIQIKSTSISLTWAHDPGQFVLKTTPSPLPSHGVQLMMEYLIYQHVTRLLHPLLSLHYLTCFLVLHISVHNGTRVVSLSIEEVTLSCCHHQYCLSIVLGYKHMICIR